MEGYPNSEAIHAAQIAHRRTPLLAAADEWQVGSIVEGAYGHTLRCQLVRSKGPLTVGASRRPIRPGRTAWQVRTNQIWSQAVMPVDLCR